MGGHAGNAAWRWEPITPAPKSPAETGRVNAATTKPQAAKRNPKDHGYSLSQKGRDLRASFARRPAGINPRPRAAGALDGCGYRDDPGVRDSLEPRSRNLSRPAWPRRRAAHCTQCAAGALDWHEIGRAHV